MKYGSFLFLLLCFWQTKTSAQLFDFTTEWFTLSNFFMEEYIAEKKIQSISISKRKKLDGRYFSEEKKALYYSFSPNGKLTESNKYTHLSNRIDTSSFIFFYNRNGTVFKRIEKEGPFRFSYYFMYEDQLLQKEIKIDNRSLSQDTAYLRYYQQEQINEQTIKTTFLNSIHRPYKHQERQYDVFGQLIYQKDKIARSLNFSEYQYRYRAKQLIEKNSFSTIGKQVTQRWEYEYKEGKIDLIRCYVDNQLVEKIGFTSSENGLIQAIITRNIEEQSVSIYQFEYDFFD